MKVSVITITCRSNPRLAEAARTLSATVAHAGDTELEWIIVDELGRDVEMLTKPADWNQRALERFTVQVVRPPELAIRQGPDRAPAHNNARNAGLAHATGDYVVLLNDCNVVTEGWLAVARDCAKQGVGWRCKTHEIPDRAIPATGVVRWKDHHDNLRPVPFSGVAGPCFGAPMRAFREIDGFDLSYDGQRKGNDNEAILRMARNGLVFVGTERAFTVQLRRTKIAAEISTLKEAHAGNRNIALYNDLKRDTKRVLPLQSAHPFGVEHSRALAGIAVVAPPVAAAPPVAVPPPARAARPANNTQAVTQRIRPVAPPKDEHTLDNGARETVTITDADVGELDVDDFGGLA